jgi:hypothetical protein
MLSPHLHWPLPKLCGCYFLLLHLCTLHLGFYYPRIALAGGHQARDGGWPFHFALGVGFFSDEEQARRCMLNGTQWDLQGFGIRFRPSSDFVKILIACRGG